MKFCLLCAKETEKFNHDQSVCDECYERVEWMWINAEGEKQ